MEKYITLGVLNTLVIDRITEPGIFLMSEDDESVLLPNAYITDDMQIGEEIEVFIHTDSEDRLVATTLKPYGMVNDIVALEVVDLMQFGAFCDMGLPKDLLVPKNKQKSTFSVGQTRVVKIIEDENTGRLIGTEKYVLDPADKVFLKNAEVEIMVYAKSPLGYKVVVNKKHEGMIFHTEIFENIEIGDSKRAYVKYVRDDGKMDISLQKIGKKNDNDIEQKIIDILVENGGELGFTYKSDAEDIKEVFGISKKSFKSTLTKLIENKKIILGTRTIKVI
ncbi:MAG: S1-like domain-containing RNA-binding protein [Campylobacterales bacterium]|nr:S1-like domain-containing RNA-binding protein [Campylobacterales bacterium]